MSIRAQNKTEYGTGTFGSTLGGTGKNTGTGMSSSRGNTGTNTNTGTNPNIINGGTADFDKARKNSDSGPVVVLKESATLDGPKVLENS